MRPRVIYSDFSAHMKTWYRSKGTMFWGLVFPIMLMALFGTIFGSMFDREYTLFIQDQDQTDYTAQLIEGLSQALVVKQIPADVDIREYIADEGLRAALHIPRGFTQGIQASMAGGANTLKEYFLDVSSPTGVVKNFGRPNRLCTEVLCTHTQPSVSLVRCSHFLLASPCRLATHERRDGSGSTSKKSASRAIEARSNPTPKSATPR